MATWMFIKGGFARVVLALAMLAFVFVPTADAAICAPEPVATFHSHAVAPDASQSEQAPDDGVGQDGEACLHGHCHHQGHAAASPLGKVADAWAPEGIKRPFVADAAPPGADLSLPQRPPRS